MIEYPGEKRATETSSAIMATLSLYLIILAFFIMVDSFSQREGSRTEGVLDSISNSFKKDHKTALTTLEAADQGADPKDAAGFDKSVEDVFESAFPLAKVKKSARLGQIEITLPLDSIFASDSAKIQSQHTTVLDRLANILESGTPGKIHEVEVLLSWAPPPDADDSDAVEKTGRASLAVNRAGALARELTARGVPAATIAIGIERRDSDKLRLLFFTKTISTLNPAAGGRP